MVGQIYKQRLYYDSIFMGQCVRFGVRAVYQAGIVLYEPLLRARVTLHAFVFSVRVDQLTGARYAVPSLL
jgi:hypothetical protein